MRNISATFILTIFIMAAATISQSASAQTPTISITTPTNNATVNCSVLIDGQINITGYYQAEPTYVKVTNSVTHAVSNAQNHNASWDTTPLPNGTYELQAVLTWERDDHQQGGTSYSNIVTVTVKNGYVLAGSGNVAKVLEPANNATLHANGEQFTISSTHTVVWTRYDACKPYSAHYQFLLQSTYPNGLQTIAEEDKDYNLPLETGACPYSNTLSKLENTGGQTPAEYQVFAKTSGQESNDISTLMQAAVDGTQFSMVAP